MPQPHFRTEKEIEALLVLETRELPMPDGSTHHVTCFKLIWDNVQSLILNGWDEKLNRWGWSRSRLAEEALRVSEETGRSFEDSFEAVVSWLRQHAYPN